MCEVRASAPATSSVSRVFGGRVTSMNALSFFPVSPQHYFLIVFGHDGQKPLELRTEEESECDEWVEAIQQARYDCDTVQMARQETRHEPGGMRWNIKITEA